MPGGRLTREDREQIAAGLAAGLGYAEIARRLSRPTSTVTREVTRNGGPDDYRADRAQRATGQRARRRASATGAADDTTASERERAVRGFEEHLIELLMESGTPRMPARVLTRLYTTDSEGLTAAELARQLRVSPASISHAIANLEVQELVRRERDPGSTRRERYLIDNEVWYRAWLASARSVMKLAGAAREGATLLGAHSPGAARLSMMSQFLDHIGRDTERAAEHWRQVLAGRRTEGWYRA